MAILNKATVVPGVVTFNVADRISEAVSSYREGLAGSKAAMQGAQLARKSLVSFLTGLYPTREQAVSALTFVKTEDLAVVLKWCYPTVKVAFDLSGVDIGEVADAVKELVSAFPGEQQGEARKALLAAIAKAVEPVKIK